MRQLSNITTLLLLTLIIFTANISQASSTDKYFGNIRYNHVSPHVDIKGVNPLTKAQSSTQPHYIFTYAENGKLSEIIDNSYHVQKRHPLTNFGAYKVTFSYKDNQETRLFFDVSNQPMANIKGVYKEVYSFDKQGFKHLLSFYNKENKPMESRWRIASYQWFKKDNWVIENRFNLKKEKQSLSPYFHFATTAIEYDALGNPYKHFNLNENLVVTNNKDGVAYYLDNYNEQGLHIKYAYYNEDREIINNQWAFAYAIKNYNQLGNYLHATKYDINNKQLNFPFKKSPLTSAEDKAEIKRIATGYLVALQQRRPQLMKEVMHKDLSKHTVANYGDGGQYLRATSYKQMVKFAESWNNDGTKFPPNPNNQAIILDSTHNMASVKLLSDNWYEYLHLVKLAGKWQIKNLLWTKNE
ncbi:MAG: nuclear transport factor 2 family protein [Colwellia sp.]|nr:nuclear transport factor 2 family protein [Colwellia sp.]